MKNEKSQLVFDERGQVDMCRSYGHTWTDWYRYRSGGEGRHCYLCHDGEKRPATLSSVEG